MTTNHQDFSPSAHDRRYTETHIFRLSAITFIDLNNTPWPQAYSYHSG
jgi:hypothetical protein